MEETGRTVFKTAPIMVRGYYNFFFSWIAEAVQKDQRMRAVLQL